MKMVATTQTHVWGRPICWTYTMWTKSGRKHVSWIFRESNLIILIMCDQSDNKQVDADSRWCDVRCNGTSILFLGPASFWHSHQVNICQNWKGKLCVIQSGVPFIFMHFIAALSDVSSKCCKCSTKKQHHHVVKSTCCQHREWYPHWIEISHIACSTQPKSGLLAGCQG